MSVIDKLEPLRRFGGQRRTTGLDDGAIRQFAANDRQLHRAIDQALAAAGAIEAEFPGLLELDENEQIEQIQQGFLNFYHSDAINPYVALGAAGPWLVTLKGAVLYDTGGYGMLGLGHAPEAVLKAMNKPHVMANIMTPNVSQMKLMNALRKEVGHKRDDACPYATFLCLKLRQRSGFHRRPASPTSTPKLMTEQGGRHAGRPIKRLALEGWPSTAAPTARPSIPTPACRYTKSIWPASSPTTR